MATSDGWRWKSIGNDVYWGKIDKGLVMCIPCVLILRNAFWVILSSLSIVHTPDRGIATSSAEDGCTEYVEQMIAGYKEENGYLPPNFVSTETHSGESALGVRRPRAQHKCSMSIIPFQHTTCCFNWERKDAQKRVV